MNTIGKILVVFVTASSLSFLAFVAAFVMGGPDWQGELRAPEVARDFVIETERGDAIRHTAIYRRTEAKVSDKKLILAEVAQDVRKKLEQEANSRLSELQPIPQRLQDETKKLVELIAADRAGVEAREQELNARSQQLWQQTEAVDDEFSNLTLQTQDVMKVAQERREEGLRLSNQLQILRNDRFAAEEQQKSLSNELFNLERNKVRLERRREQLKKQLGESY